MERLRSSRSIAAIAGGAALAATVASVLVAGAVADPMTGDPNQDEIFANRSESFIDPSPPAGPLVRGSDAEALTAAVKLSNKPVVVEWGEAGAAAVADWAQPGVDQVTRTAARYEPQLSFAQAERSDGPQAQVRLEFGPAGAPAKRAATPRYMRLGESLGVPAPLKDRSKGRWFLFAATGGDALGVNMLRGRSGELRRSGWSAEKIAAVGDAQLGFGWRKGPLQASVAFVEREISAYGKSADESFVAFTFSIRPDDAKTSGGGQRKYWIKKAEQGPGRQPYRH